MFESVEVALAKQECDARHGGLRNTDRHHQRGIEPQENDAVCGERDFAGITHQQA
jgi:hypothetical protein